MQFSNPEVAAKYERLTPGEIGVANKHFNGSLSNITPACADQMFSEGSRHLKEKKTPKPPKPPKEETPSSSPAVDDIK